MSMKFTLSIFAFFMSVSSSALSSNTYHDLAFNSGFVDMSRSDIVNRFKDRNEECREKILEVFNVAYFLDAYSEALKVNFNENEVSEISEFYRSKPGSLFRGLSKGSIGVNEISNEDLLEISKFLDSNLGIKFEDFSSAYLPKFLTNHALEKLSMLKLVACKQVHHSEH
ncbi:hypothetical protein [Microbulbifer hainanensis]|uniref:hypothetical protein n=1 Tax=Microbulbifer hainanensis TaxID=2735675 RepID=UPI001866FADF|nr:hypothetical protein [Microbulbifer hainanensis]